ncbi:hypothetical protein [Hymenobacter cellulosivorans]|uniref:HTH LytTR-type domain-containing protein n=1 Tax=Hymenobacter cellulosivorans TaxID=2932249 RepID=A0ABY4FFT0_9BACT|nr:hypothetical protein [Hymenobacter cellulosivorans]UOQ55521.1 hypothetical protein MUN80_12355 [Hymenobacter cellulosivorans]
MQKIQLWNLTSRSVSDLMLWRTEGHVFRVMKHDKLTDVLTNYDYVLLHQKYRAVLTELDDQLAIYPATIVDTVRNTLSSEYIEVAIKNSISFETISTVPADGLRIYVFEKNHVFVSAGLKQKIRQVENAKLAFSLGFSHFA